MKKIMVYALPILIFIVLTFFREVFDFDGMLYSVSVLFIVLLIPVLKAVAKEKSNVK